MNKNEREYLVRKIRAEYTENEHTEFNELKEADKKVKAPANIFAWSFGSISALVMGAGMSLIMTDIGKNVGLADTMITGLVIGIVGMLMAIVNYPIYKKILTDRREKYAEQIIALADRLTEK